MFRNDLNFKPQSQSKITHENETFLTFHTVIDFKTIRLSITQGATNKVLSTIVNNNFNDMS